MAEKSGDPHEFQHPDAPTWCVWCGEFDTYARHTDCTADRSAGRRFDTRDPDNAARTWGILLGVPKAGGE